MKNETAINETSEVFAPACIPFSLHHLVSRIAGSLSPETISKKILIINNVPENIYTGLNDDKIASVLNQLMYVIILNTEKSSIRITAKMFGDVVLMHVKDDGCLNYDSVSPYLAAIQAEAEKMGGFVGFTSYRNKLTTIAFSFMNQKGIA